MGIVWILIYRDKEPEKGAPLLKVKMGENFRKALRMKEVWLFAICFGFIMGSAGSMVAFLPIALQEKGISHAGELVSIMLVTALIFKIVGGIISDQLGKRKIFIVFGTIIAGICFPGFILFSGVALILLLIIAGIAQGPLAPAILSSVVGIKGVDQSFVGTVIGFIVMIGSVGGAISPLVPGVIMDTAGTQSGFLFMAALFISAGVVFIPAKVK